MFYSSFFIIAFAGLPYAVAIPLRTRIIPGTDVGASYRHGLIDATMPTVNHRIDQMATIANHPYAQTHPAVVAAFGTNPNIGAIRDTVNRLQTSRITVPHTDVDPFATQGVTNPHTGHITFGQPFYSSDTNTRAGTIIHEATHALAGTVDAFDAYGRPYNRGSDIPRDRVAAGVQIGYQDSHLNQLKHYHSDQMHRNADSYRVFSQECGRYLYRRAMAEPHPIIRSRFLRRVATACARKPKPRSAVKKSTKASPTKKSQVKRPAVRKPAARPRPAPPRKPAARKPAAKTLSKAASKPAPKPGKRRK